MGTQMLEQLVSEHAASAEHQDSHFFSRSRRCRGDRGLIGVVVAEERLVEAAADRDVSIAREVPDVSARAHEIDKTELGPVPGQAKARYLPLQFVETSHTTVRVPP